MQDIGRLGKGDYMDANGTVGQILKVDSQTIVVKSQEGVEKIVLVNEKTEIKRFRETVKLADLKTDELIVTIGEPNEAGQIVAKLIRVMPPAQQKGAGRFPNQNERGPDQLPPPTLNGAILTPTPQLNEQNPVKAPVNP